MLVTDVNLVLVREVSVPHRERDSEGKCRPQRDVNGLREGPDDRLDGVGTVWRPQGNAFTQGQEAARVGQKYRTNTSMVYVSSSCLVFWRNFSLSPSNW